MKKRKRRRRKRRKEEEDLRSEKLLISRRFDLIFETKNWFGIIVNLQLLINCRFDLIFETKVESEVLSG